MGPVGVAFVVSLAVALVATLACERVAPRLGLVVAPRADRWHRRPVALLGGVAIMLGVLPALVWAGGGLRGRLAELTLVALAMGTVGLVDDVRPLRPPVKLVAQIVLAGLLVERDFVLRLTGVAVLDVVLTLIWVVGITNAFNLLDNMDGLAAGMAVIAGGFRLALFLFDGDLAAATMTAGFVGAVVGFLVRNAPPARIFMGDAGSLFLGFFLSGLCLVVDAAYYSRGITAVLAVPVLLVLIPIFDTTFVTVTRLLRGQPVSQGGRDHTSHRLVALGGSEGRALAVLYGLSIIGGGVALLTYRADLGTAVVLLPLLLVGLTLLGIHLSQVEVVRAGPAAPGPGGRPARAGLPVQARGGIGGPRFGPHRGRLLRGVPPALRGHIRGQQAHADPHAGAGPRVPALRAGPLGGVPGDVAIHGPGGRPAARAGDHAGHRGERPLPPVHDAVRRPVARRVRARLGVPRDAGRREPGVVPAARRGAPGAPRAARPVLVYGAGDGGELALRELRNNAALARDGVGFIDDDRAKAGTRIHGVPVLGPLDELEALLRAHPVEEVVVASRKIPTERLRRLEASLRRARGGGAARIDRTRVSVEPPPTRRARVRVTGIAPDTERVQVLLHDRLRAQGPARRHSAARNSSSPR